MKSSRRIASGSPLVIGPLVGALLIAGLSSRAMAQWRIVPELRVAGGDESDLIVDPALTGAVVPGGAFAEISPAVTARGRLGKRGFIHLSTFATLQRFLNDEARRLYAHTVSGDAFWNLGASMQGRVSILADYFDDSERESVRRLAASGELGVSLVRTRWNAELWVGGRGRRYPNIDVLDSRGRESTYEEATWSGGVTARLSPHDRLVAGLDGVLQRTDSRDPLFDSDSWTASASADARITSRLFGIVSGTYQQRRFTGRAAGEDTDEYRQVGAGIRYVVAAGWDVSLRWGYSNYTWPDGSDNDSHRLAVAIHYAWGRRQAPLLPPVDLEALAREGGESIQRPEPQGAVRFRVHAPGAAAVSVAGSFNEWSVRATPLGPAGGGWWEATIDLEPGTYEYAYVIDGRWTTPPEARFTTEDGFGGLNGILEVLQPDA